MPLETPVHVANELARRGYNAEPEAVTLLASTPDPAGALDRTLETVPDDAVVLTADHVKEVVDTRSRSGGSSARTDPEPTADTPAESPDEPAGEDPPVSTGTSAPESSDDGAGAAVETGGSRSGGGGGGTTDSATGGGRTPADPAKQSVAVEGDIQSTGTGEYSDFVAVFRDRYEKLSKQLRGRVNHRPTDAIESMPGNSEAAMVGMVSDIRSTASGHWLVELEDTNGTFPCLVMKDRDIAALVQELLLDEVIAVDGTLADDGGILFVDSLYFPEIPRTYEPSTADREVEAALISDVHVGSQEFEADAWHRFTDWLHTADASAVEYLLIAGDMVEGVGVYPDQDEELDIVDIYEQYERFSEYLKEVPGDVEIIMIPGNHDAVRLAEPQPAFDEELRDIMSAHDARISGNPSTVTVEGVDVLMYHGVSLDEVIAELPDDKASYDEPHKPMYQLLKKRHVAPQFGGQTRLAPEEEDHLVMESVPDVFHSGHVHKLGYGKYHNVLTINSGCWQAQTDFQKSVNIDPDVAFAPIVSLDTLDLRIHDFE
ncbi:DNA-directed DNA polymerase II small subunit [Halosimplex pelagicum]|uniref:DNA polymerase II small subunit n=1 Tax=Halosimplex pelagicum TaxID=869886 RepID=A0A7D5T3L0_9EURY|nr:DNA-directed DNA polymerase II small subunit [Halosimplex pelagicum]QLH80808.1 DNA-directed DNA polymerase II small subunit [Halosimplex pelagicum]